jgi:hypothetical protein
MEMDVTFVNAIVNLSYCIYILEGSISHGCGLGQALHDTAPPPPHALVSIEQLLATQNEFMSVLV